MRKRMRAKAVLHSSSTGAAQPYTTRGYLDEVLHIAIKQLMVIHGAWPRLPHFLWFRGKGGGSGKWWTKGTKTFTLCEMKELKVVQEQ